MDVVNKVVSVLPSFSARCCHVIFRPSDKFSALMPKIIVLGKKHKTYMYMVDSR